MLSGQEAAAMLAQVRRERARRHLLPFTLYTYPIYQAGWFHKEICDDLDQFLADVIAKKSPRLIIQAPPRSGKTELVSRRFPPYALGKRPDLSFIATSYAADLSSRNNRDVQRVMEDDTYGELFPETRLWGANVRTVANGSWMRNSDIFEVVGRRGVYRSAGVGGGITGMGADVAIIDDPIKDDVEATSDVYRQRVWDWYTTTLYTRLAPGGGVLIIMCMTGDTPVLMADGTEKPLAQIAVGDNIATYRDGALSISTVRNWKSQGCDSIYEIRTRSGRLLRANERHPFLVCREGGLRWIRLKNLKVGDRLVGASGVGSSAGSLGVGSQLSARASARPTTTRTDGLAESVHPQSTLTPDGQPGSSTATGSAPTSTTPPSSGRVGSALSVESHRPSETPGLTGTASSASTTITRLGNCGACCATTATSPSATAGPQRTSDAPLSTYRIEHDEIVAIVAAGREEVFDLQVEETENFIANGVVAHNTRWHEDDLVGRLLEAQRKGEGDKWVVKRYPAIAEEDEKHRKMGEALHPERYPVTALVGEDGKGGIKQAVGGRVWVSLYQQRPSAAGGTIFQRDNWRYFKMPEVPPGEADPVAWLIKALGITRVVQSWDTAHKMKEVNDFSSCVTFGEVKDGWLVLDVLKRRMEFPELKRTAVALHAKWRPHVVLIEDKSSGQSLLQELKLETRIPMVGVQIDKDKVARANAVSPLHEAGRYKLPEGADWVYDFVNSMSSFPNGAHDDDVDAFTQGAGYLRGGGGAMGMFEYLRAEAAKKAAESEPKKAAGAA